jgi:hypothetical protein
VSIKGDIIVFAFLFSSQDLRAPAGTPFITHAGAPFIPYVVADWLIPQGYGHMFNHLQCSLAQHGPLLVAWSTTGAWVWVIKAVVRSHRRHVNQRLTFMPQDCRKYMEMNVDRERLHICCFTQRPSLNCINRIRNQFCYTWQQIKGGYVHIPHDFFATFHLQSAYLAIYIHAVRLLIFSFK